MSVDFCPEDGYPMQHHAGFGGGHTRCTNPWHPIDPGPCPECGSPGFHRKASFGTEEATCGSCSARWKPDLGEGNLL